MLTVASYEAMRTRDTFILYESFQALRYGENRLKEHLQEIQPESFFIPDIA